ncbi:hypothetical protein D3C71_1910230 [compost metagenome]
MAEIGMQGAVTRQYPYLAGVMLFRHRNGATFTRYKKQLRDINHTIYLTSLTPQQPECI